MSKKDKESSTEQLVAETVEQIEAQASEQPAPADDIGSFLDDAYEGVEIPAASLDYDRDITSSIVALVVANPVMRAIAEFLGVAPENFVQLAWGTSYDRNAVSDIMLAGNVEMLQHHPNVAIKNALNTETQKASAEQQNLPPARRREAFFLGTTRFICRILGKEAEKQGTKFRFTFEPGQTPEGQPWDSFTRVAFRHHKASEAQRERAKAAAMNRLEKKGNASVSSYADGLKLS